MDERTPIRPKCPDCGSQSWSQLDNDPLVCSRCGTEWLVQGLHSTPEDAHTAVLTIHPDLSGLRS